MIDTKILRPTVQGKIIQLDYDFITSLTGECEYCLTDAQVQMILSIVDYYGWPTRWFSSDGLIDQTVIDHLQGGLIERLMMGCCPDNSILTRYTNDGHYQQSGDGGSTWSDAPNADPRNPQPYFPPYLPDGTIDASCTYADSVVNLIKDQLVGNIEDDATASQIISTIISVVAAIMGALSETVIGTLIAAVMGAIAIAIVTLTVPLFQAAMTTDVWDRLRCNISEHVESDGTFTQDDIDAIYAQITTDETGIALLFLHGVIAAFSMVGLSNAANAGYGAPDAECCATGCDISTWDAVGVSTVVSGTKTTFSCEIDAGLAIDGFYYAEFTSPDSGHCCNVSVQSDGSGNLHIVSGAPDVSAYSACGHDPSDFGGFISLGFGVFNMNGFYYRGNAPFRILIDTST